VARESPLDTFANNLGIPIIRALLDIQRNQGTEAVAALIPATPYEMGGQPLGWGFLPTYVRGEAYLRARDGSKAAPEFQKILDHHSVDAISPLYSLSQLQKARAYAMQGDVTNAKLAYQDFLATWKDADANIPVLTEAKTEYAKLQ
jgi:eukaryotic-like serine/threonine-protein kinase